MKKLISVFVSLLACASLFAQAGGAGQVAGYGGAAAGGGGGGGGGTPGGSSTQVQYNNAGSFGGITGATSNGTTLTLVAPVLGTPASATLTNATGLPISTGISGLGTGIATWLATPSSANLAAALTNETGTGAAVFATSPTLVTPVLGTPTSVTLTNATGLPVSTGISGLGSGVATFLGSATSANLAGALTDETGYSSGALAVFSKSPTIDAPIITGTTTYSGGAAVLDVSSGNGTISATGGGSITISAPIIQTGSVKDSASSFGTSGQVLKTNGSGVLTYQDDKGSYLINIKDMAGSALAASTTLLQGWDTTGNNTNAGRYKIYVPKTGTIKTIIFYMYGSGGDGSHSLTVDVLLNGTTSVGSQTLVSNVFPGIVAATGLTQAVTGNGTSGTYLEYRIAAPSGMTTITSFKAACDIYIETAL